MTTEPAQPLYSIDPRRFEENQRSFDLFVTDRLCPACQEAAKDGGKKKRPNPIDRIAECCSGQDNYLSANLPLLEMIFRLFLTKKNQPLSAAEISRTLSERLLAAGDTRNVSPATMRRLMDNDQYYGLSPVPPKTEESPSIVNVEAVKSA